MFDWVGEGVQQIIRNIFLIYIKKIEKQQGYWTKIKLIIINNILIIFE